MIFTISQQIYNLLQASQLLPAKHLEENTLDALLAKLGTIAAIKLRTSQSRMLS